MQQLDKEKGGEGSMAKEYERLLIEINCHGIKHKDIQKELNVSKAMFSRKIHGSQNAKFSVDEAIKIQQKFFPTIHVEDLFKR